MFSKEKTNIRKLLLVDDNAKSDSEIDKAHNQQLIRDYEPGNLDCLPCIRQNYPNILNTDEYLLSPSTSFQHGVTFCEPDAAFSNGFPIQGNAPYGALPSNFHWNYNQELLLAYKEFQKPNPYNTIHPTLEIVNNSWGINSFLEPAYNFPTRSDLDLNKREEASFSPPITAFNTNSNNFLEKYSEKPVSSTPSSSIKDKNILLSSQEICSLNHQYWASSNFPYKALRVAETQGLSKFYDNSWQHFSNDNKSENLKVQLSETDRLNESNNRLALNLLKGTVDFNVTKCSSDKTLTLNTQTLNDLFINNSERQLFETFEMSGQYPGHSRPPVGTPPPQTVWNHLTMTQGQGLNIHPTALSGASLNPAGFYTHPSMARASHLTPQLTPQLAHTQAPPTWHTPTVPAKTMTSSNTAGNPLFSLQMLVDNRQNQNQYRNAPGVQSSLDLSATSEMAENYSRIPQDIPISLTARSIDKGSRNGNIISPPIPLNGDTSCDSGISSSVPTPNSLSEPVSLSTKEVITPKITVKNFESNLKGVSNLHDKLKDSSIDSFVQKVINLPPNVTIERVTTEKKDTEVAKCKDTLSVIAQVSRNIMPVIVNLTSKDKDVTDSPNREPSVESDRKMEDMSVRSPKTSLKRGAKKGVDSLLEKLESGSKKLGMENIGSVIVTPVEEKDAGSVKSMSPERQISRSPNRDEDVISPFSNEDSNDNTKQRRKRKLEKPVRLSKDSKTEVEDMELEPTEPTESRSCEMEIDLHVGHTQIPLQMNERVVSRTEQRVEEKIEETVAERTVESVNQREENTGEKVAENLEQRVDGKLGERMEIDLGESIDEKNEENQPVRRRRCSEGPTVIPVVNQRVRRKSSDDATDLSKVSSPKITGNANPFNEVESELEKMFAGIVETSEKQEPKLENDSEEKPDDILKSENVDNIVGSTTGMQSTSLADVSSSVEIKSTPKKAKKGRVRAGKRKTLKSDNVGPGGELKDGKKGKATKGTKKQESSKKNFKKNTKVEGLREVTYDSGSNASSIRSRGPVVHVEGPRDSPLSIQVVNVPREEEEEKSKEKRKNVGNGNAGRSKRLSHQNDLDYRGKVNKAGLFSSTLSSRYDAHTTDSTWVCVFCKQGPHSVIPGDPSRPHPNLAGPHIAPGSYIVPAGVLSDLFGPYLIGKERLEDGILSADEQEIMTEQKKGGKNKRSLRYAGLADQFTAKMSKKKRNSVESGTNTVFTGMTLIPGEEQRWEVWLHEQCAVWAAGVYLAGGRVTGLQEAVWDAAKSVCDACGLTGANIGCVKRGCKAVIHYPCALTKSWLLDSSDYIPKCNIHRVT